MAEHQQAQRDPLEASRMTLGGHLDELRIRLIRAVGAVAVAFLLALAVQTPISHVVLHPLSVTVSKLNADSVVMYEEQLAADPELRRSDFFRSDDPEDQRLREPIRFPPRGDGASSGFFFIMRVCFYFALFAGGPFALWQLWKFVAAGLYENERKLVMRNFPFSAALFLGGVLFGYFLLVPYGMYFLVGMSRDLVEYDPRVDIYFSFLTSLSLALGVVFQLPILMVVLTRLGIVEPRLYGKYRGHFIVGSLVVAAILTPPDPVTQMMMAIPMVVLYELGNLLAIVAWRRRKKEPAEEPAEEPAT